MGETQRVGGSVRRGRNARSEEGQSRAQGCRKLNCGLVGFLLGESGPRSRGKLQAILSCRKPGYYKKRRRRVHHQLQHQYPSYQHHNTVSCRHEKTRFLFICPLFDSPIAALVRLLILDIPAPSPHDHHQIAIHPVGMISSLFCPSHFRKCNVTLALKFLPVVGPWGAQNFCFCFCTPSPASD